MHIYVVALICFTIQLVPVAEQAGLSLIWSQTPKTGFLVTRLNYRPVIFFY